LNPAEGSVDSFAFVFPEDAGDVLLAMTPLYTVANWRGFAGGLRDVRAGTLCLSRGGREVPVLRFGNSESPRVRVLVTARHHCCETMGSFVVEGFVEQLLEQSSFLERAEVVVVPLVDADGVEAGDQGKNRRPHDHNRDYDPSIGGGIYPETVAIREMAAGWEARGDGVPLIAIDVHCPWIRGNRNEMIYQVGSRDPGMWEKQVLFGGILERVVRERAGSLPYVRENDLAYGLEWNVDKSFAGGMSFGRWATGVGAKLVTVLEVPYANAQGGEVLPGSARGFGRDLGRAVVEYVTR
jgi:hypothetical protein